MRKFTFWTILLTGLLFGALPMTLSAQFFFSMADQTACPPTYGPETFTADYVVNPGPAVSAFEWRNIDYTFSYTPIPGSSITFPPQTSPSGVVYTMTIADGNSMNSGMFYTVSVTMENYPVSFDGITNTIRALDASNAIITSTSAKLSVYEEPTFTLVDPIDGLVVACEGEAVDIQVALSNIPEELVWEFEGATIPGEDGTTLSIAAATVLDAGDYQPIAISDECGISVGPIISVDVIPGVVVTDVDMAPKPCAPGETVTFTAEADNVDALSTYTWVVGGSSFTVDDVPGTVVVDGNTLEVSSIVNSPTGLTSATSTVTISNISAPGAPAYTADVQLEVSNNQACVGTTATVMSSTTSVFPVEWLSFSAKARDAQQVELHWATASETNNEIFVIERALDAKTFEVVGQLRGMGTTTDRQDYTFVDDKLPAASRLSYRIKQVDYDGQYSYSDLRSVVVEAPKEALIRRVYQQGGQLNLSVYTPTVAPATVELYDLRGVRVYYRELGQVEGYIEQTFDLPAVSGMYVLRFRQEELQLTQKVVLTR